MSASLVGSEMCIRDSYYPFVATHLALADTGQDDAAQSLGSAESQEPLHLQLWTPGAPARSKVPLPSARLNAQRD
eukprot:4827774-Alexandrium_andersonii.AAC.1